MSILTQITESYLSNDYDPCTTVLDYDRAREYFSELLDSGNVMFLQDVDKGMTAWMEVWFLDEEQTRKVVLDKEDKFRPLAEDILEGDVCYVADLFVRKELRGNPKIIWELWKKAEEVHRKPKVIFFERRRLDKDFRVFKGGG